MTTENYNFHGLFHNSTDSSFIKKLDLDQRCLDALDGAVKKVKETLTPVLRKIAEAAGVVEPNYRSPRYRLQGSKVYGTQNSPAHTPEQQVDVDLGTYLAATFLDTIAQQDGKKLPVPAKHIAKIYFETVDEALRVLCRKEGWKYLDGNEKKHNCCRIDLSPKGVDAHIDVPLYAMPNQEFEKLEKAAIALDSINFAEATMRQNLASQIDEDGWEELDVVVMATRQGEWSESDVQKVILHFREASSRIGHPVILRRLWRYVKAWRDQNWREGGGPSSILLMEAVTRIIEDTQSASYELLEGGRDDRILAHLFTHLGWHLNDDVTVTWGTEPESLNRGTQDERQEWVSAVNRCAKTFDRCFVDTQLTPAQVIGLVTQQFGQRIPSNTSLVKSTRQSPALLGLGIAQVQVSPQERVRSTQGA